LVYITMMQTLKLLVRGTVACVSLCVVAGHAAAVELLIDPGFEDTQPLGGMGAPWRWLLGGSPDPMVNNTAAPRTGEEHASITLDTAQIIGQFGPAIGSSAFAGFGAAEDITDFTGLTLTVTNNIRVTEFNMSAAGETPLVLVRTYLAYFGGPGIGFLGYGGIDGDFPGDTYVEGVTEGYFTTSYTVLTPNFGTPVTSVEYTIGLVAPNTEAGPFMTGSATVYFDDVSLALGQDGDFDGDGDVDGHDFLAWQQGETTTAVSVPDLDEWKANYGFPLPMGAAAAAAVPEPTAFGLLLVGSGWLAWRRRDKTRAA
jgi:hypothetical protein